MHGTTKTGTTRGAASSGPDQAQEQARSGGRTLQATEDSTLRLTEKASNCRRLLPKEETGTRDRGVKFQKWGESTGSQDERCHGNRNNRERC